MAMLGRHLLLSGYKESEEQQWQLVGSLFRQSRSLAASGIGTVIAACVCWRHTGSSWYVAWGLGSCLVLAIRLVLAGDFHRNRSRLSAEAWAWAFFAGAVTTATIVALGAGLTALVEGDLVATLYMATHVLSFAGGATVRNSASPLAAVCQTTISLGVTGLACLLSGKPYLQTFAFLILLQLVAQFEIIRALGRTTGWLISAERRQAFLNERLSTACAELEGANGRLSHLSATDALTGLLNRRAFDAEVAKYWTDAAHPAPHLGLLMIDADYFKKLNDRHGHIAGDEALRWLAGILQATLQRPTDIVARFGGEEFAVLLPDTDLAGAVATAERIRGALALAEVPESIRCSPRLTVSIGASVTVPAQGESHLALVRLADEALYAAKRGGRDRVETACALAPLALDSFLAASGA